MGGAEGAGRRTAQRRRGKAGADEAFEEDRGGGFVTRDAGHRAGIGSPDPDAEHMAAVIADRPGVAVAVGRAGLVGDAARRGRRPAAARAGEGCR